MSRRRPSRIHGVLPVYKEAGPTSHDVVDMARKALGERRIGHTGTLDPMAEGLLLLCVGQATRLQQFLMRWNKTYLGEICLGYATETYDAEGESMDPRGEPPALDPETLAELERRFSGEIEQVPPPFSAKKVAGRKLYELARTGQAPDVEPKRVTVHRLELHAGEAPHLKLEINTSTGFYVRSLAHDIGIELGCGAHLHRLRRVAVGPYAGDRALPQAQLAATTRPDEIVGGEHWVTMNEIQLPFPDVSLNRAAAERFIHGQEVVVFRSSGGDSLAVDGDVLVRGQDGSILGIGAVQAVLARGRTLSIRPAVVLQTAPASQTDQTRHRDASNIARRETS